MLFNSIDFMIFFPIAVFGYYVIPRKVKYIWLLMCSYYFYMGWNPKYALLIATSTILTFIGSILIERINIKNPNEKIERKIFKKKLCLGSCIILNMAILFYFKYANFFFQTVKDILSMVGVTAIPRTVDVLLPVGISFYTFQALSYIIDVYRGDIKVEKNILKYALFVSFFPQLVAGPIERSKNLLPQIQALTEKQTVNWGKMYQGSIYMLYGLFMKMIIADRISILVDTVFNKYYLYGSVELIAGAIGFAIQIYCDFASYSYIAMGTANILGIDLMENFDAPYFSTNVQEFWRRWHISLSTWFRDYLYIPLGGSRCSRLRKNVNLMITFLVSGLWHGASLNFVVWGGIHGIYLVLEECLKPVSKRFVKKFNINTQCFSYRIWKTLSTFIIVDLAWIFFRAKGIVLAIAYIKRLFTNMNPWVLFNEDLYQLGLTRYEINILIFAIIVLVISDWIKYEKKLTFAEVLLKQNLAFQVMVILGLVFTLFTYGMYGPAFDAKAFIYFQF